MNIEEKESYCPYCGESISLLIDSSLENQEYVEDCQVCCSPIFIRVELDYDDNIFVNTRKENE